MYYSNYMNSKCFIKMFEMKKVCQHNKDLQLECKINKLIESKLNSSIDSKNISELKVYPKTISIILNNQPGPDNYFIKNSKLYKYDINGQNPQLTNGNFLIAISDNSEYLNKIYKVSEGNLQLINTYFDGTNLKLIINGIEEKTEGTLILTDDYKLFVRIGNNWFSK
jgi:hypothetical protein